MREVVIDNELDMKRILDACDKGGHSRVAAISNAGLSEKRVRITILPTSAFKADAPKTSKESWLAAFREAQTSSEAKP